MASVLLDTLMINKKEGERYLHCREPVQQKEGLGQTLNAAKKTLESKVKPKLSVGAQA